MSGLYVPLWNCDADSRIEVLFAKLVKISEIQESCLKMIKVNIKGLS